MRTYLEVVGAEQNTVFYPVGASGAGKTERGRRLPEGHRVASSGERVPPRRGVPEAAQDRAEAPRHLSPRDTGNETTYFKAVSGALSDAATTNGNGQVLDWCGTRLTNLVELATQHGPVIGETLVFATATHHAAHPGGNVSVASDRRMCGGVVHRIESAPDDDRVVSEVGVGL